MRIQSSQTKTKVITTANQIQENISKSQWELKLKSTKLSKARENVGDQVVICFCFASDWWRSGASFLNRSQSGTRQNPSNSRKMTLKENWTISQQPRVEWGWTDTFSETSPRQRDWREGSELGCTYPILRPNQILKHVLVLNSAAFVWWAHSFPGFHKPSIRLLIIFPMMIDVT